MVSPFAISDIMGHVIIGFVIMVLWFPICGQLESTVTLHGCKDMALQRYWGHDFDLLGSRDAIGHVTIRLAICGFVFVLNLNRLSSSHGF